MYKIKPNVKKHTMKKFLLSISIVFIGLLIINSYTALSQIKNSSEISASSNIDLLAFNGFFDEKKIELYWSVANDVDNNVYVLERSINSKNFENVTSVKSNTNKNKAVKYSTIDENPPAKSTLYYRLKQTNNEGNQVKYSEVIIVKADNFSSELMFTQPSVSGGCIKTKVKNSVNSDLLIEIENPYGTIFYSDILNTRSKLMDIDIKPTDLKKGSLYFLKISNGNETIIKKFIY